MGQAQPQIAQNGIVFDLNSSSGHHMYTLAYGQRV
jgi:hypothetical protein